MEPMEHENSRHVYRSYSLPSPSASPPVSPSVDEEVKSDVSDMEIDHNSPPAPPRSTSSHLLVRSSSSLDFIKTSLDDILSLRKKDSQLEKENVFSGINFHHQSPLTGIRGCHSVPPIASPARNGNRNNSLLPNDLQSRPKTSCGMISPAVQVLKKKKIVYGLDESDNSDMMFSHFPNSHSLSKDTVNESLRNRGVGSSPVKDSSPVGVHPVKKPQQFVDEVEKSNEKRKQMSCTRIVIKLLLGVISLYTVFSIAQFLYQSKACLNQDFFQSKVLEIDLKSKLFGQHIASSLISKHLNDYFKQGNFKGRAPSPVSQTSEPEERLPSSPPLVLSFHGWTGVGKNFASHIISRSFTSVNIHTFVVPLLFPHSGLEVLYGRQLEDWIWSNITDCTVNVFLIDEMDKAFPAVRSGLLKTIQSMRDGSSSSAPVIFLIISNTHAADINRAFVEKFHHLSSKNRLEIKEEDFYPVFQSSTNDDDWSRDFTASSAIDAFIPFLPLERSHVIDCIKRDLVAKHFSTEDEVVSLVLDELSFARPVEELDLSTTGCKRVSEKIDFVIHSKLT